jgi:hypothetical protein
MDYTNLSYDKSIKYELCNIKKCIYLDSKPFAELLGQWHLNFATSDDNTALYNSAPTVSVMAEDIPQVNCTCK